MNLAEHDEQLSNDDGFVQLIGDSSKIFLVEANAILIDHEYTIAVVTAVHKERSRDAETNQLGNFSEFLVLDDDSRVLLELHIFVEKADVD